MSLRVCQKAVIKYQAISPLAGRKAGPSYSRYLVNEHSMSCAVLRRTSSSWHSCKRPTLSNVADKTTLRDMRSMANVGSWILRRDLAERID